MENGCVPSGKVPFQLSACFIPTPPSQTLPRTSFGLCVRACKRTCNNLFCLPPTVKGLVSQTVQTCLFWTGDRETCNLECSLISCQRLIKTDDSTLVNVCLSQTSWPICYYVCVRACKCADQSNSSLPCMHSKKCIVCSYLCISAEGGEEEELQGCS